MTIVHRSILIQALHWLSVGTAIPILVLLQQAKGLSLQEIGFTMGLFSTAIIASELPTGNLADRLGRRRVYILSLWIKIISMGALIVGQGFIPVAGALMIMGFSRALSSGSIEAYFIDAYLRQYGEKQLPRYLAQINIAITSGLAIGGVVGGYLPRLVGEGLARHTACTHYDSNLLFIIALSGLLIVLTSFCVPKSDQHHHPDGRQVPLLAHAIRVGLRNTTVRTLLFATTAWGISFGGLETYWQPHLRDLMGLQGRGDAPSTVTFGYLTSGYFLAAAVGGAIVQRFTAFVDRHLVAIALWMRLIIGAFFILLARQTAGGGFGFFYITLFFTNGILSPTEETLFNRAIPAHSRSTLLSLKSFALQMGGAVAAPLMGLIATCTSTSTVFIVGGVVFALSALLYTRLANAR